jgi:NAD(P)-dependent dehydrogenase (short-subunit alcohol dehydrogenase family)
MSSGAAASAAPPVAIIFGASGNIGSGAALHLLSLGWRVVAPVRDAARCAALAAAGATLVAADISTDAGADAVTAAVAPLLPRVALVVAALGAFLETPPLHALGAGAVAAGLASNVTTHALAWRAAGAPLLARGAAAPRATYALLTGKAGEGGSKALCAVADAAVFGVAACARHEAAAAGGALRVVELRLFFRVEEDAAFAAGAAAAAAGGAAHNGGRPVRASSDFARVFSALARARDDAALDEAGAGPVRLVDPAAFDALLRRCGAGE